MPRLSDHARRSDPRRYLVAVGVIGLAAALRLVFALFEPQPPILLLLTGAAGISAWFGGLGPALLTIALSVVLDFWFFEPHLAFAITHWTDLLDLGIFALVALAVAWLCESLHAARRQVEDRARELARAEATERAWKNRYDAAVRASDHVLYEFAAVGGRAVFSGACQAVLGHDAQELGERADWTALIHPDDLPRYLSARAADDSIELEYRLRHRSGRWVTVHDAGQRVVDHDGVARIVGFLKDVTAQRQAEALVRASEERLRLAVEATGLGVTAAVFTRDGAVQFEWTREARRIVGLADDAPLTIPGLLARVHPDDLAAVRSAVAAALDPRGDGSHNLEFRVVRPDGEVRWIGCQGCTVFDREAEPPRPLRSTGILRDITERKATAAQLAESFALIDALVLKAPIGMAFIDHELRYVRINEKLAEFNGLPAEAHVGRPVAEVVPDLWPTLEPLLREGLRAGSERVELEVCGQTAARVGEPRHWSLNRYPIRAGGKLLGLGVTVVETTAQKRIEASLREADHRKDTFIATLAHELRNPLAPIRNALALLGVSPGGPEQTASLAVIGRQVEQMARLLDDLLDVSRITRGRLTLHREPLTLASVMARAAETANPSIAARRHRFVVDLPSAPILLDADPVRLAQVFSNLFTNAAKYTEPEGTIRVTAAVSDARVEIVVADTGVGIAPEQLPRLFEMFSQINPTGARAEGGLGIGLALARGLVAMHGGTIAARSPGLGCGSEFVVDLPLAAAPAARPPREPAGHLLAARDHRRRIVVADDNVDNADTLAMLLEALGNEVRVVYDGEAAMRACAEFRPDIVFLDIGMPKRDGYEVCRWIRQQPWAAGTLVIAQTGWGQDEDRRRAATAGFDHHITKPADPEQLLALLTRGAAPRSTAA